MHEKNTTNELIGKKMIQAAVDLDKCLADILRIEIKRLKQLSKSKDGIQEIQKTNNLIKNIIIALTITDEKIKTGIDIYFHNTQTKNI